MKHVVFLSPDTLPLPLKDSAPECIIEDGKQFNLKDKCSRTTGLGIRIWRLAEELAKAGNIDVTVLVPDLNYPGKENIDESKLLFKIDSYNFRAALWNWSEELDKKLKNANYVIVQTATGVGFKNCSVLPGTVNVIVDGFVPMCAELPCTLLGQPSINRKITWEKFSDHYFNLLLRANCVLYANDRQYYYYEGQFFGINKLNWKAFMFSPLLKVPYGVDVVDRVEHKTSGQKFKLLWFGPTYPWYNPEKLLDVLPQLENTTIDFVSIKHPRYGGSYNKFFKKFFDACSSYTNINIVEEYCDDPAELYSHYDAGIILARDWLEEKYSTRCRTVDMLTHGLPVIMNKGNSFFNELFFLRDGLYPITTKSIKRDLMHLEKNRATVKISEENRISLQKKLSWSVVSEELINYILKF